VTWCGRGFRTGALFSSGEYVQAQRVRNVIKREFANVLQQVTLCLPDDV